VWEQQEEDNSQAENVGTKDRLLDMTKAMGEPKFQDLKSRMNINKKEKFDQVGMLISNERNRSAAEK